MTTENNTRWRLKWILILLGILFIITVAEAYYVKVKSRTAKRVSGEAVTGESTNRVIHIKGTLALLEGGYNIEVFANGSIVCSNYPVPVVFSQLNDRDLLESLGTIKKAGYWNINEQGLKTAVSNVIIQDCPKVCLEICWQGKEKVVEFERARILSTWAEDNSDLRILRQCLEILESRILKTHLP